MATGVHVFHPPASRFEPKLLDWTGQDQQPYIIDVVKENGTCRVHRHFQAIQAFTQQLDEQLPGKVAPLVVTRSFFGRFRFSAFADTDAGELRRTEVAKHVNSMYKLCKQEGGEALETFMDFFTPRKLFAAIAEGNVEEVKSLLSSQTQTVWDCEAENHYGVLHHTGLCALEGISKPREIGEILLEFGADPLQLDNSFRSPLMVTVSEQNKEAGEAWENFVFLLISSGSDLLEVAPDGNTLLHKCIHHKAILEEIISRVDRLKDDFNADKQSPYTLATDIASQEVQSYLRSTGARKQKDFEVIHAALDEQTKQFDGFLEESSKRGDHRETITILVRQADLQLLDHPMRTAKILNCALHMSNEIQMDREEIYEKLFQTYHRLAFTFQQDIKLPEPTSHMDLLRKRKTKMQEIRSNSKFSFSNKKTEQAFKWFTEQYTTVIKNVVNDCISILGAAPCSYAILGLGPFARYQCSPSSRIQFSILISEPTNENFEYFRFFVQLFELTVINLQETPFKVLNFGTESPIHPGLHLDYNGNIPYALSQHGPFSFVGSPFQLARLQEPNYFKENANASATLWEVGFITGDKKQFDLYRIELDRILNRKENIQTRTLRQQRAVGMIRTDVQDFVPDWNRDIDAEARFELHRYLVGFPVRIITWLCWYYKIDLLALTHWDRIDRLCSAGVLSKEGAKNLKTALTSIMELYIRSGEKKIVDIGTAIKEFNSQNPPYDSDGEVDENEIDHTHGTFEALEMETDESFDCSTGNLSVSRKDEVFVLRSSDVEQIAQSYLVLIPLHNALKEWLRDEHKNQEKASLKSSDLYDGSNTTLAEVYLRLCHYEKAKYYFRAAIEQNQQNFNALNTFGVMWNKLGNYKKAIKYYEKAVIVIEKEKGENAPQLSTQYNNVAMAHVHLNQNLDAIQWLEKALRVDESVYGDKHPFVARDYRNIGLMAWKELQFDKALDYLRRGLAIDSEHYGDVSAQVAMYYNDIARVYQGMENYDFAIEYYEKALAVDKQLYTDATAIVASRYLSLAGVHKTLKDNEQALVFYEKALEIYSEVHGDDHLTVATTLFTCGDFSADMDQLEKALEYLKRSYASFKKIKGKNDHETEFAYKRMKEVEMLLQQRQLHGDEYEKWKLLMEQNRQKSEEIASGLMEMEGGDRGDSEDEEWVPKVYGPDSVQQCKLSVFEDDFFEL